MKRQTREHKAEAGSGLTCVLVFWFLVSGFFFSVAPARADDLIVDTRSLQMSDLATVTITLEGAFAEVDELNVPVQNLRLVGEPSVSSEFAWVNGQVSRRKVFRYQARGVAPGAARVGPVIVTSPDGQRETLPAIAMQVSAAPAAGSNDAEAVLRGLLAARRDPLFVVAEVSKQRVWAGEPIVVTWMLYNATSVQEWQIASVPKLADFWTEELTTRDEQPERVYVGDLMMQRVPARRAVLSPLRSGLLHVEGMTIEASVMRQMRGGPFAMFEGELVNVTFTSAPFDIDVMPLPPGPPVDAVGDLGLSCDQPVQRNRGPVVVQATLSGLGNVRAAPAPRFERNVDGHVEIEGGEVSVSRDPGDLAMTRRWRYLIFPNRAGILEIPPLTLRVFDTKSGQRRDLRCEGSIINARWSEPAAPATPPPTQSLPSTEASRWWWAAGAAVLALALLVARWVSGELRTRRVVRDIVSAPTPQELRARVDARLRVQPAVLLGQTTERAEAYRALLSLLEARERDRDIAQDADAELSRRVRDVLTAAD